MPRVPWRRASFHTNVVHTFARISSDALQVTFYPSSAMDVINHSVGHGFSIREELDGSSVLITGALGFVGSLLVEQLLRTTEVGRVYVLVRGRRGQGEWSSSA